MSPAGIGQVVPRSSQQLHADLFAVLHHRRRLPSARRPRHRSRRHGAGLACPAARGPRLCRGAGRRRLLDPVGLVGRHRHGGWHCADAGTRAPPLSARLLARPARHHRHARRDVATIDGTDHLRPAHRCLGAQVVPRRGHPRCRPGAAARHHCRVFGKAAEAARRPGARSRDTDQRDASRSAGAGHRLHPVRRHLRRVRHPDRGGGRHRPACRSSPACSSIEAAPQKTSSRSSRRASPMPVASS